MAESAETPQATTVGQTTESARSDVATESASEAPTFPQTKNKGFFGKVFGFLGGRKQESGVTQVEPQETPDQTRARLTQLQADKKNLETSMKFSDSTGSSKIQDNQRMGTIDKSIEELMNTLPPESSMAQPINAPATDESTAEVPLPTVTPHSDEPLKQKAPTPTPTKETSTPTRLTPIPTTEPVMTPTPTPHETATSEVVTSIPPSVEEKAA